MKKNYNETLDNLARELVNPERFGFMALNMALDLALLPGEVLEPGEVAQGDPFPQLSFDMVA